MVYRVIEVKGWSYIEGPTGALDGPWRYKWEAKEEADRLASAVEELRMDTREPK